MRLQEYYEFQFSVIRLRVDNLRTEKGAVGTGFIIELCNEPEPIFGVVTNRHIASAGTIITAFLYCAKDESSPLMQNGAVIEVPDENFVTYHPNPNVDLAILPLTPFVEQVNRKYDECVCMTPVKLNYIANRETATEYKANEQVVSFGFPYDTTGQYGTMPVFRQGKTVTHPLSSFMGLPQFLSDIEFSKGASGSPVFRVDSNTSTPELIGVYRAEASKEYRPSGTVNPITLRLSLCVRALEVNTLIESICDFERHYFPENRK